MSSTALTLQIGGDVSKLKGELNKAQGLMGGFKNDLSKVGGFIAGAFSAAAVIGFGKAVYDVTAQFQKFEAVLNTSLGSNSKAQLSMKQIEEFASVTPFSVQELTGAFVKLANQGFAPTTNELRKLGDLAASTGKSFDQLAEAIIDAQTGEFERLKEFGIRAKKEGDKVTFTFKGVETQTKFTSEAIREYILSLGDAIGVSGSMAAISETLGGKMSNLGDSWDQFLKTLGDQGSGPFKNAINNLNLMLSAFTQAIKTSEQLEQDANLKGASKAVEHLEILANTYGDLSKAKEDYLRLLNGQLTVERKYNNSLSRLEDDNEKKIKDSYAKIHRIEAEIKAVTEYTKEVNGLGDATKSTANVFKAIKFKRPDTGGQVGEKEDPDAFLKDGPNAGDIGSDWMRGINTDDPVAGIVEEIEYNEQLHESLLTLEEDRIRQMEQMEATAQAAVSMGESIGSAFEGMISGSMNFAQALTRVTEDIVTMFLKQSIAAMIASHLKDPTTSVFPWAKVAAATAGIGIVKGMFSALGGSMAGGGGSGGGTVGVRPSEMKHSVGGRIRGYDLALVTEKESYRRSRVG